MITTAQSDLFHAATAHFLRLGRSPEQATESAKNFVLGAGGEAGRGTPGTPSPVSGATNTVQAASGPASFDLKEVPKENRAESHAAALAGKAERDRQVLEGLKRFPDGATAPTLAAALGLEPYVVRPRLTELHQAGKVWVIGKAWYPITERNISIYTLPKT